MKKNRMMRLASILLVCVLLSTSVISGTFAKYVTTGSADDTARVAKWGVNIITSTDATAFAKEYKDSDTDTNVVVKSDDFVVAPGTDSDEVNGNLVFGVTGTPEVAAKVTVNFTGSDIFYNDYHPIKFTLHILDNNSAIADVASADWTNATKIENLTLSDLTTKINSTFGEFPTAAGETLDALYKITWAWEFGDDANNVNDTMLGNLAAGTATAADGTYSTVLNYSVNITVEQVD